MSDEGSNIESIFHYHLKLDGVSHLQLVASEHTLFYQQTPAQSLKESIPSRSGLLLVAFHINHMLKNSAHCMCVSHTSRWEYGRSWKYEVEIILVNVSAIINNNSLFKNQKSRTNDYTEQDTSRIVINWDRSMKTAIVTLSMGEFILERLTVTLNQH